MADRPPLVHADPRGFDATRVWIFDLDNTLYPAECDLFAQVSQRMGAFVSELLQVPLEEARRIQKKYYYEHGTTLAGLMAIDKVDPHRFLDYVHDIDYSPVPAAPGLAAAIAALPGRRIIYTNGSRRHAERVAERLGITHLFEEIFDIADAGFLPKPRAEAYDRFLARHGVDAGEAAMFEDLPANLEAPHALGMTTVLVHADLAEDSIYSEIRAWAALPDHVHHATEDLATFLEEVAGATPVPGGADR